MVRCESKVFKREDYGQSSISLTPWARGMELDYCGLKMGIAMMQEFLVDIIQYRA